MTNQQLAEETAKEIIADVRKNHPNGGEQYLATRAILSAFNRLEGVRGELKPYIDAQSAVGFAIGVLETAHALGGNIPLPHQLAALEEAVRRLQTIPADFGAPTAETKSALSSPHPDKVRLDWLEDAQPLEQRSIEVYSSEGVALGPPLPRHVFVTVEYGDKKQTFCREDLRAALDSAIAAGGGEP